MNKKKSQLSIFSFMQDTNIHTGVYEQIINRLFKQKLNEVDTGRFYIGKKLISKDDASQYKAIDLSSG